MGFESLNRISRGRLRRFERASFGPGPLKYSSAQSKAGVSHSKSGPVVACQDLAAIGELDVTVVQWLIRS
jgi:hypothetical protein